MVKYLFIFLSLILIGCSPSNNEDCQLIKGKVVLVAYKISKHSKYWVKNVKNNDIYELGGLGGRREPIISLGDTIDVTFCYVKPTINIDKKSYVKKTNNNSTFKSLNGYEKLR